MRLIIYNSNSFGGNYNYSCEIAREYRLREEVESCIVLSPSSQQSKVNETTRRLLLSDESPFSNKILRKLYFLFRSFVNPFRLYRFLKSYPDAVVIFNDYDQLTAPVWAPFFKSLKRRHLFAVILHDPDRDGYLFCKTLSVWTMKKVMAIIDIAFYHELLPDKPYYHKVCSKVKVPHGIYFHPHSDTDLLDKLRQAGRGRFMISILGNVRAEKNYELAFLALKKLPYVMLLVAGAAANSRISVQLYKDKTEELGVAGQVLWIDKFLSDAELQSCIIASDILLMCYKPGFTSQSGILNLIAPHKKDIIVGNSSSALQKIVSDFSLGQVIPLTAEAMVHAIDHIKHNPNTFQNSWHEYNKYASWDSHVDIAIRSFTLKGACSKT